MSAQNLSNKLSRGTIKYSEVLEIAEAIDYKIVWLPKEQELIINIGSFYF